MYLTLRLKGNFSPFRLLLSQIDASHISSSFIFRLGLFCEREPATHTHTHKHKHKRARAIDRILVANREAHFGPEDGVNLLLVSDDVMLEGETAIADGTEELRSGFLLLGRRQGRNADFPAFLPLHPRRLRLVCVGVEFNGMSNNH